MPALAQELQMNTCHNYNVGCTQQVKVFKVFAIIKGVYLIGLDGSNVSTYALNIWHWPFCGTVFGYEIT